MAMVPAGVGVGKLLLAVTAAGIGGTVILGSNSQLSALLADLSKVMSKHFKEMKGDDRSGGEGYRDETAAALTAQVRRLTQELRQLAASAGRPIVVHSGSSGSVVQYVVPVAVLGVVGYGYMWWKGFKLGDLMYVTKRSMDIMVSSVGKQMQNLSSAISATKRQITGVSEEQKVIKRHVLEMDEVMRGEFTRVQDTICGMDGKMDDRMAAIEHKQDFTNQGILLLCRFVVEGLEGSQRKPELIQGLHAYSQSPAARSITMRSTSGLKDLADIMSSIEAPVLPRIASASASSLEGTLLADADSGQMNGDTFRATPPLTHTKTSTVGRAPRAGFFTRSASTKS